MTTTRHADAHRDDEFVLAVLNTTPVIDGTPHDQLADAEADATQAWLSRFEGAPGDLPALRRVRDDLQRVVRGEQSATTLNRVLRRVHEQPEIAEDGTARWSLEAPDGARLAVRAVLGWAALQRDLPGRLRACANDECRLFLLDRSRANSARWCSMAACGNRLKARRHQERTRARRA